ncbi:hypothetical protein AB0L40_00580 [Patulibacter sp. NPDC049589]|uniref:hypothetical protein n=1 Tax=Patulibacter sp. NPDC049589 TaxID=3154731 RepID=UPI00343CFD60
MRFAAVLGVHATQDGFRGVAGASRAVGAVWALQIGGERGLERRPADAFVVDLDPFEVRLVEEAADLGLGSAVGLPGNALVPDSERWEALKCVWIFWASAQLTDDQVDATGNAWAIQLRQNDESRLGRSPKQRRRTQEAPAATGCRRVRSSSR